MKRCPKCYRVDTIDLRATCTRAGCPLPVPTPAEFAAQRDEKGRAPIRASGGGIGNWLYQLFTGRR